MKNKGYTLIELLGVIVILAVLIMLVFPSVINFIKSSNEKKDKLTEELIISAAEDYISDNSSELYLTSGTEYCISIDALIGKNYLSESAKNSNLDSKNVKVTYTDKINYEIVDHCSVCQLISGNYNKIGSKYQCKVKDNMETGFEDGYYFYLLSINEDKTINLIMERNMHYDEINDVGIVATSSNSNVAWYADARDNSYGPITAMNYLHSTTKDWYNVPNIMINYIDENASTNETLGYGSIVTVGSTTEILKKDGTVTAKYNNLKARMPYESEITEYDSETMNNAYIYDYLSLNNNIQTNSISGIEGYWIFCSTSDTTAKRVKNNGALNQNFVDISGTNGVRPVITIKNMIVLN